jgi:hypothetical protein
MNEGDHFTSGFFASRIHGGLKVFADADNQQPVASAETIKPVPSVDPVVKQP